MFYFDGKLSATPLQTQTTWPLGKRRPAGPYLNGDESPCSVATNLEATPATPEFVAGSLASTGVA